jgi:hypothetical protein
VHLSKSFVEQISKGDREKNWQKFTSYSSFADKVKSFKYQSQKKLNYYFVIHEKFIIALIIYILTYGIPQSSTSPIYFSI